MINGDNWQMFLIELYDRNGVYESGDIDITTAGGYYGPKSLAEKYLQNLRNYWEDYRYLGAGSTRAAFLYDSKSIVKVPLSPLGTQDNAFEAKKYKQYLTLKRPRFPLAECELLPRTDSIKVLKMELLDVNGKFKNPDWVYNLYDGEQVGIDKKGVVKCYDFALEFSRPGHPFLAS